MFSMKYPTMVQLTLPFPFILSPSSMQYLLAQSETLTYSGGDGEGGGATFSLKGERKTRRIAILSR